ncbi:hypothetical protein C8R45DRAFT_1110930 [Mycena sanguinolenta]|nr:hypothetical protein C8R45DRAFT_1110930 [Mycena sanguinolenta]
MTHSNCAFPALEPHVVVLSPRSSNAAAAEVEPMRPLFVRACARARFRLRSVLESTNAATSPSDSPLRGQVADSKPPTKALAVDRLALSVLPDAQRLGVGSSSGRIRSCCCSPGLGVRRTQWLCPPSAAVCMHGEDANAIFSSLEDVGVRLESALLLSLEGFSDHAHSPRNRIRGCLTGALASSSHRPSFLGPTLTMWKNDRDYVALPVFCGSDSLSVHLPPNAYLRHEDVSTHRRIRHRGRCCSRGRQGLRALQSFFEFGTRTSSTVTSAPPRLTLPPLESGATAPSAREAPLPFMRVGGGRICAIERPIRARLGAAPPAATSRPARGLRQDADLYVSAASSALTPAPTAALRTHSDPEVVLLLVFRGVLYVVVDVRLRGRSTGAAISSTFNSHRTVLDEHLWLLDEEGCQDSTFGTPQA